MKTTNIYRLGIVSILLISVCFLLNNSTQIYNENSNKTHPFTINENKPCEPNIFIIPSLYLNKTQIENKFSTCLDILNPLEIKLWNIKFEKLSADDFIELSRYMELFRTEFNKYPVEFVKKTRLERIAFVKNLSNQNVKVSALPDALTKTLYFDIYQGNYDKVYEKRVIHHEYYHMIEYALHGTYYYRDPNWISFNRKGFTYGSGGSSPSCQKYGTGALIHPQIGFINNYSTCGIEEDRADIFGTLLTDEERDLVFRFALSDSILSNKINYMRNDMKKYGLIM